MNISKGNFAKCVSLASTPKLQISTSPHSWHLFPMFCPKFRQGVPAEVPPGPASQAEVAPGTMPPPAPPPPPQLSSFGIDMVDFGIDPRTTQSRYSNNSQQPRSPAPRVLFRLPRQVVLQMQRTINNIDREE